jgi:hypothetical protein
MVGFARALLALSKAKEDSKAKSGRFSSRLELKKLLQQKITRPKSAGEFGL